MRFDKKCFRFRKLSKMVEKASSDRECTGILRGISDLLLDLINGQGIESLFRRSRRAWIGYDFFRT